MFLSDNSGYSGWDCDSDDCNSGCFDFNDSDSIDSDSIDYGSYEYITDDYDSHNDDLFRTNFIFVMISLVLLFIDSLELCRIIHSCSK